MTVCQKSKTTHFKVRVEITGSLPSYAVRLCFRISIFYSNLFFFLDFKHACVIKDMGKFIKHTILPLVSYTLFFVGLNSTSKCLITLRRQDQHLIIEKIKENELEHIHPAEKYNLSSLFSLLEDSANNQHSHFKKGLLKITILDLSFCDLTELPRTLKLLHLKVLNVSNNKLTKIPSCLYAGGLESLESLDLSHNQITQFDIQPDCVANLKCLKLNNNQFTNLPRWFLTFRCSTLEELNYSENKATHYNFLKHSCNFQALNLKKLVLKSACLIDTDFVWLQLLKNLECLDISNGELKFVNKFKELSLLFRKPLWLNLKVLHLSHLNLAFLPEDLFWITSLKELYVSYNFLSWFPDGIEYLEKLEVLDVSHNELIILPNLISQLEGLKILIASHNNLDEIPQMPVNLEVLDVYDNYITNINMDSLDHVKQIDLDCNCFDVNCDEYYRKRDSFRTLYKQTSRISYTKALKYTENYFSGSSSSDSDLEYDECEKVDNHTQNPELDKEDWNTEYIQSSKNQTTDELSDDDFTGYSEVKKPTLKPSIYLYCEDEDWIFEDAD